MLKGINVVAIPVTDLAVARAFYGDTLGLGAPLFDLPDAGWLEFGCGGAAGNIALTTSADQTAGAPGAIVVLNVEDCAAAVVVLRERGVSCDDPKTFPGYVTFATFTDPFGNRLQICSAADS